MKKTYDAPAKRVPNASSLADRRFAKRVVRVKKGRGSYSRKGRNS